MSKALDEVEVKSRAELRAWLKANHAQNGSIWLVSYKKAAGALYLPYNDIVEEALCFGWVDSLPRKRDDMRSMLLLSPRKPGSAWSRANKLRIERLLAQGLIAPPGLAKVEAAKADGSWSFLDEVEDRILPDDLQAALAALPPAAGNFAAFPASTRRGILEWIKQARRPDTRAKRIEETARLAQQNIRANQFRR